MRWPWSKPAPKPEPRAPSDTGAPQDAKKARQEAKQGLEEARGQWKTVLELAQSMRQIRNENHFAEKVAETMRRRGDV